MSTAAIANPFENAAAPLPAIASHPDAITNPFEESNGAPDASSVSGVPKPQVDMETSALGRTVPVAKAASDVAQGIGAGALSTVGNIGKIITDPIVQRVAPDAAKRSDANLQNLTAANNTTQGISKGAEQFAEFLTPTGLETEAAKMFPKVPVLAKMGAGAVDAALKNKAQGGSAASGAIAGAAGAGIGEGLRKIAPTIAESALGVTASQRGNGKTIGQAVLDETKGISPSTLKENITQRVNQLTQELETRAANSTGRASTAPALHVLIDAADDAHAKNAGATIEKINQVWDQLTKEYGTGKPIPSEMSPRQILDLKRGIGDLITKWTPQERQGFSATLKQVYGALDKELDRTVPGAQDLNQRISSLIPAKVRAAIETTKASASQRVLNRVTAHTGALAGAGIGSAVGYREGGAKGALIGGAAGLAGQEALTSPTARMALARGANALGKVLTHDTPAITGDGTMQTIKGALKDESGELTLGGSGKTSGASSVLSGVSKPSTSSSEPSFAGMDFSADQQAMEQAKAELAAGKISRGQLLSRAQTIKEGLKSVKLNGSGESSASAEAISRVAGNKSNGTKLIRITRSGQEVPIANTVDAVDMSAQPGEQIVKRYADGHEEIQDTGRGFVDRRGKTAKPGLMRALSK